MSSAAGDPEKPVMLFKILRSKEPMLWIPVREGLETRSAEDRGSWMFQFMQPEEQI
jgi:hypothetical protein